MKLTHINKDEFEIIDALKSLKSTQKQQIIEKIEHTKSDDTIKKITTLKKL